MPASHTSPAGDVVIAGGGVAALEAVIALRDLAGDRATITLVAPEQHFVYRPMTVGEPFGLGDALRVPLRSIAERFGAKLVRAAVLAVDPGERQLIRAAGGALDYGTLIVAVGARAVPAFGDAIAFTMRGSGEAMRDLVGDVERGTVRSVAFVAPSLTGWPLPLYEIALMTARVARSSGRGTIELFLVSPETEPLEICGPEASMDVADRLERLGIEFVGGTYVDVSEGVVMPRRGGRMLEVDRVVALPLQRGPQLAGLPAEPDFGFIPTDRHGRVEGVQDVYAAGDVTDFPIKQGGLATQQADAVARHIASRLGADVDPEPFRPVLRGMLFTGGERFFQVGIGERAAGLPSQRSLWWPPTKIAGRYLAPYLAGRERTAVPETSPPGFTPYEVRLDRLRLPSEPYDPVGPGASTVA